MTRETTARIAVLTADGVEKAELTIPRATLEQHGASFEIISLRLADLHAATGSGRIKVDWLVEEAEASDFDALYLPGGAASCQELCESEVALAFIREFDRSGKPIAAIAEGSSLFAAAAILNGRRLASAEDLRDTIREGGGFYEKAPLVRDGNWLTSGALHDLPHFSEGLVSHFALGAVRVGLLRKLVPWIVGTVALSALAWFGRDRLRKRSDAKESSEEK